MTDNSLFWVIELKIKKGEIDSLKTLLAEMSEATRTNEPGTLNYEWFLSEDESSCHIYERYRDSAALVTHLKNFGASFAERFLSILEPTRFVVYGDPNEEARGALAAMGPAYFVPIGGFVR